MPFDLSECCIMDSKGNVIKLSGIETIKFEKGFPYNDEKYASLSTSAESSFTIRMKAPHCRGMHDNLFRPYTSAACRYRRWAKRKKEKERRRKLKDGKSSMP